MTATERLRALLDERGVEWGESDTNRLFVTSWNANGHSWAFMEHRDGSFAKLTAYHLTPEQAIAATLGSDEVAELRELIRHMRCCFNREYTEVGIDFIATRCEDCEYDNASGRCDFGQRLAELGMEVDE